MPRGADQLHTGEKYLYPAVAAKQPGQFGVITVLTKDYPERTSRHINWRNGAVGEKFGSVAIRTAGEERLMCMRVGYAMRGLLAISCLVFIAPESRKLAGYKPGYRHRSRRDHNGYSAPSGSQIELRRRRAPTAGGSSLP